MTQRRLGLLALCALALALASVAQGIGWNQSSHYALVRALADGTAIVDEYRDETGDVAWTDGHYYSTKPPGLAFLTLPVYLALDATGSVDRLARFPGLEDGTVGILWILGLVGCVLPAVVIALLVRRLGELLAPGHGTAAAVVLVAGTLLLPFATLFFSHVLAAAFGYGAFAALWLERERGGDPRPVLIAVAGVAAGLAVVVHYSLAIVAGIVGLYAVAASPRARNGLLYVGGALAGVAPLLLYDWWAFGSPAHLSYRNAVLVGGESGHDVLGANAQGFFGVGTPSLETGSDLLLGGTGLVTLAPVVAAGAVGLVFLYGLRRAETVVAGAVAIAFVLANSGYVDPFGGFSPGPRFLIPVLPFLGVPLALALRRLPVTTVALAAISIVLLVAVTVTRPLLAHDGRWLERIENGSFGGHGILPVLPFALLVLAAIAFAAAASPRPAWSSGEAGVGLAATGGWVALFLAAPTAHGGGVAAAEVLAAATLLGAVAVVAHVLAAPAPTPGTAPSETARA